MRELQSVSVLVLKYQQVWSKYTVYILMIITMFYFLIKHDTYFTFMQTVW